MKRNTKENLVLWAAGAVALGLLVLSDHSGLPRKWHTAIFGTVVPFSVVIAFYPKKWKSKRFWKSFAVCLLAHSAAIVFLFEYVIGGIAPGWLLWSPIAFVESIVLVFWVRRVEAKLRRSEEFG